MIAFGPDDLAFFNLSATAVAMTDWLILVRGERAGAIAKGQKRFFVKPCGQHTRTESGFLKDTTRPQKKTNFKNSLAD